MRLTDVSVRALPLPEKGQKTYWDDTLQNFGCRVSQGDKTQIQKARLERC